MPPVSAVPFERLAYEPLTVENWGDFEALFTRRGVQNGCWCMYWRLKRSEFHRGYGEPNKEAMRRIVESGRTPGILVYLDEAPVGWCSVAPREEFPVLDRSPTLKRVDDKPVWSIVCFYAPEERRGRGIMGSLIKAAVGYAASRGAEIVEAYPVVPEKAWDPRYEVYTGVESTYRRLGFVEAARRSEKRIIMRYTVPGHAP
ncbi:MAG TPA: GNAT family N-acetyltransferase [Candidatus Bathyarchaeia archaeon]